MQRWRFIRFVTVALALLAAPGWLPAQEPAKKEHGASIRHPQPRHRVAAPAPPTLQWLPAAEKEFQWFAFASDPAYGLMEKIALWVVLGIAIAGLVYAVGLVSQVIGADEGTERMREVGAAIRQGANAYLARQFKAIVPLMFVLTGMIWATPAEASQRGGAGPGGRLLHGGDILLAGRLRGDEPGGAG